MAKNTGSSGGRWSPDNIIWASGVPEAGLLWAISLCETINSLFFLTQLHFLSYLTTERILSAYFSTNSRPRQYFWVLREIGGRSMLIYPWGTNSFSSNHRASRCHHLVTDILDSMWDKSWRCYWKEKTKGALILTAARQNFCILFWQTLKNRLRRGRIFIFLPESHTLKNSKPALELKPWEGT